MKIVRSPCADQNSTLMIAWSADLVPVRPRDRHYMTTPPVCDIEHLRAGDKFDEL